MPISNVLRAKRCLMSLLLRLALAYHVTISINRDSSDAAVLRAHAAPVSYVVKDDETELQHHIITDV